jgi:adenylate cyclase class 2
MSAEDTPEIEVKFLDIDHDDVRSRLERAGAQLITPMRGLLRLRRDGGTDKIAYKSKSSSVYLEELETEVGSLDIVLKILAKFNIKPHSYQETRRESWSFKDTDVELDEWPWLRPYIEIESHGSDSVQAEQAIKTAASDLGLDWEDAKFGSADTAYRNQYPGMSIDESIASITVVRFEDPIPDWLTERIVSR